MSCLHELCQIVLDDIYVQLVQAVKSWFYRRHALL